MVLLDISGLSHPVSRHVKSPLAASRDAPIDFFYDTWEGKVIFPPFCHTHLPSRLFFQGIPATFSGQDGQCLLNEFLRFLHYQGLVPCARIISFLLYVL